MDYRKTAQEIYDGIGGKSNLVSAAHCATRLRLVIGDNDKCDKEKVEEIEGVQGVFFASGQMQIILGTGTVNKVYDEFIKVKQDGPTVQYLTELYRNSVSPLMMRLHYEKGLTKFESSLMALLADGLNTYTYSDVQHHSSEYSMYVTTN